MSIIGAIGNALPNVSRDFMRRVEGIIQPRYSLVGDIGHWETLRGQINSRTGKINSYRDIRKICAAEGGKVPALGTLRNYLGEGGVARKAVAQAEWRVWFEEFGTITNFFEDELKDLTTEEDWEAFRGVYEIFIGY